MNFLGFTLIAILILVSSNVQRSTGCTVCNWEPWEEWSDCSTTCGPGTHDRSRDLCCDSSLGGDLYACLSGCKLDLSEYYRDSEETSDCNELCVHGNISSNRCVCPEEFTGDCCSPCKRFVTLIHN